MSQFLEQLKKVKSFITFDRKDVVRAELMHFAETHEAYQNPRYTPASRTSIWQRILRPVPMIAGFLSLLLFSSGISFAAEGSLPGDLLYPIKINVNEKVRTALAFTPKAKVQVEQSLAEARIVEAETLAAQGRLNSSTKDNLDGEFNAHASAAQTQSAQIKSEGDADEASGLDSNFESQLEAHAAIIAQLQGESSGTATAIAPLAARVHTALGKTHKDRIDAENYFGSNISSTQEISAQGKITAATNAIASAESFITTKTDQLGVSATASAEAQLTDASATLAQAQAQFVAGSYVDAFRLASMALRMAQTSLALAGADVNLKRHFKNLNISIHEDHHNDAGVSSPDKNGVTIESSGTSQGEVNGNNNTADTSSSESNTPQVDSNHSDGGGVKSRINNWFHLNFGD